MGVYFEGNPSEGIYRLTYQDTSDKGMVAVLEGEDIAFIGQIVKAPHGRLIDADELLKGRQDHEMISTHLIWNAPTIEPCEDAISRETAIRSILGLTMYKGAIPMDSVIFHIKALPFVAPSRPSGEWIWRGSGTWECDNCHNELHLVTKWDYCPFCGAKMKGVDDESTL